MEVQDKKLLFYTYITTFTKKIIFREAIQIHKHLNNFSKKDDRALYPALGSASKKELTLTGFKSPHLDVLIIRKLRFRWSSG